MDLIADIWTSCLCSTICYSEHSQLAFTLCMYFTTPHMSSVNQSRLHIHTEYKAHPVHVGLEDAQLFLAASL